MGFLSVSDFQPLAFDVLSDNIDGDFYTSKPNTGKPGTNNNNNNNRNSLGHEGSSDVAKDQRVQKFEVSLTSEEEADWQKLK